MTREEAIRILGPETRRETLKEIPVFERINADQEACRIAVAALREQEERDNRLESDAVKNEPLTLDELKRMDGEPVWIDDWFEDFHGWELSEDASDYFEGDSRTVESYGTRWVAYRSKPKEVPHENS